MSADKYPTKSAKSLSIGDEVLLPFTIAELRLTATEVEITFTDSSTISLGPTDKIAQSETDKMPDPPKGPVVPPVPGPATVDEALSEKLAPPAKSANKDVWVDYATKSGADATEAAALTKAELIATYGD